MRPGDHADMQGHSPRPFGKRNRETAPAALGALCSHVDREPEAHRAFFAAMRAETGPTEDAAAVEVPRSLRAGLLAGLVVACALAGLDATEKVAAMHGLTDAMPDQPAVRLLVPALILLAVIGGGRAAATSLLLAHGALRRAGQTSHVAYAAGGAAAALAVAAAMQLLLGSAPTHGFAVEVAAGAAGGFFYRVFAGTRRKAG